MSKTAIGKTIRRLRMEQGYTQQGFAQKLGISTSYLNLVEHDQRNVTASLLFKLTDILNVDLAALSGVQERELEVALREVFADPLLGLEEPVPEAEIRSIAAPRRARGRSWRCTAPGRGRGRIRAGSRCPRGARSCCRMRRCGIFSTTMTIISQRWRRRRRRSARR